MQLYSSKRNYFTDDTINVAKIKKKNFSYLTVVCAYSEMVEIRFGVEKVHSKFDPLEYTTNFKNKN